MKELKKVKELNLWSQTQTRHTPAELPGGAPLPHKPYKAGGRQASANDQGPTGKC